MYWMCTKTGEIVETVPEILHAIWINLTHYGFLSLKWIKTEI